MRIKPRLRGDHHHFKDHKHEVNMFRGRLLIAFTMLIAIVLILIYRFYDLQILNHESYVVQSDRNRIQVRPVAPNRGLIFDMEGRILAGNRVVSILSITKERTKDLSKTISDLSRILTITEAEISNFYKALRLRRRPYEPVPLKYNLDQRELAAVAVNEFSLPGVEIHGDLVRHYPYATLFTHVVGYVGRINERELSNFNKDQQSQYAATQSIGKIGLEKNYEARLHGEPGREQIEIDARGRVHRIIDKIDPIAGNDLYLFLDLDLQKEAAAAMDGRRGAVVAIDIESGGVVSMLSSPSYDPNLFVTGISRNDYVSLSKSWELPLFNRTIQGQYPPGSTIKPMLGLAGLHENVITAQTRIPDPGYYQLENDERYYREWKRGGHGTFVDLHKSIVESCDIFFYDLGFRMGVDRMHPFGLHFGLGQKTGIDIPSERNGLWPSREWKKQARGLNWYPGNSLNMSIGQGDVLSTPLQLAVMTATMARRGSLVEPRLVKRIGEKATEGVLRQSIFIQPDYWDVVLKSMYDVVHSPRGTARSLMKNLNFSMAGKTGTAQVIGIAQDAEYDSEALAERHRDHALFIGFAPYENPQIAVAVVIENGEKSSKAGRVAKRVMASYIAKKEASVDVLEPAPGGLPASVPDGAALLLESNISAAARASD